MQKLENRRSSKRMILITLLVIVLAAIIGMVIYRQFHYAEELEIRGTVVDIERETSNHQLPKYIILDDANKKIEISHFTVALDPTIIKIGDKIVKKKGDDFCAINGKTFRFSSY